jgi:chorismate-pyruvate lyase
LNSPTTADTLYRLFPASADRSELEPILPAEMPEPYRQLLVHTHHMTVTVEDFYGQPVDVQVLEVAQKDDLYARKIILRLRGDRRVVQFGLVAIDLSLLAYEVRSKIIEGHTPLGRVLIENNVLRHIEPAGYFRTQPSPTMCEWLQLSEPQTLYGRLGVIHTDGRPAIHVMEVLSPCPSPLA